MKLNNDWFMEIFNLTIATDTCYYEILNFRQIIKFQGKCYHIHKRTMDDPYTQ